MSPSLRGPRGSALPPVRAVAAGLALAGLSLAGCSSGSEETTTGQVATPSSSPSAPPSASPTPAPAPEAPLEVGTPRTDLTPEGTELGMADEAVLQTNAGFDPAGDRYTESQVVSRITGILPAAVEDFTAADGTNPVDAATQDVYYVWSEHTLVWARSNTALVSVMLPSVYGWAADGSPGAWIFAVGKEHCTGEPFAEIVVGAVGTACTAVVVPTGQAVAHVGVLGNPDVSRDAHETVTSTPVFWRVG